MEYEFNILYYIELFKKRYKIIALVVSVSALLTTFFALRQPPYYASTVTLISGGGTAISTTTSVLANFLGLSGDSAKTSFGGASINALLQSRRMERDITKRFNLDKKPGFQYSVTTCEIRGTTGIQVKGTDPELTQKIANFVVENLDKINNELDISADKPMVRVLDPATYGSKLPRRVKQKALVSAMFSFLIMGVYIFFTDYIKRLKTQSKTQ